MNSSTKRKFSKFGIRCFLIIHFLFLLNLKCHSQITKDTINNNIIDDSVYNSFFFAGLNIGNQVLNRHNKFLNSRQSNSILNYTPEIGYFNKSGLNVTINALILSSQSNFTPDQYSITPSYDIYNKNYWDIHSSYCYYWVKDLYNINLSPIQHEFDFSVVNRKHFLQSGIEIGYSFGVSKQSANLDSTINGLMKRFYDSASLNSKSFFVAPSIEHKFSIKKLFSKSDSLEIIPCMTLFVGKETENITHNSNYSAEGLPNNKLGRIKTPNSSLRPESLNFSLYSSYSIGNFTISPQYYFDYGLSKSKSKRSSSLFNIAIEYNF